MKRFAMLVVMSIVMFSLTVNVSAKNCKAENGSAINPAGNTLNNNGASNGNAEWKLQAQKQKRKKNRFRRQLAECASEVEVLNAENDELYERIAELEAQLEAQKPAPMAIVMNEAIEETWSAEARKFAIYKMANDHPNTPNAYGVLTNFFIPESEMQNLIEMMDSGVYEVTVTVVDDMGNVINIETTLDAEKRLRDYYNNFIQLQ